MALLAAALALCVSLPGAALAGIGIELSADTLAAEGTLDFALTGDPAPLYRYTVLLDGEELFTSETERSAGSYVPREPGAYALEAAAVHASGEETARAEFTVTAPLCCTLSEIPETLLSGEPVRASVRAEGGAGGLTYIYAVASQGRALLRQEGGADWFWVPDAEGSYVLTVTVTDGSGACARMRAAFTVEPGPGLTVEESGGGLGGHGGQQSWTVYSTGPWQASTDADFIVLNSASGDAGDPLTVTAVGETDRRREGTIVVASGTRRVEVPVAQASDSGVDEEVYLFAPVEQVYVENRRHVAWTDAAGSRNFAVAADAAWTAGTPDGFIHIAQDGDGLTLSVDAWEGASVRSGLVTVRSGAGAAYIHVYQPPASGPEAASDLPLEDAVGGIEVYSQLSGLWKEKPYGSSTLEHSGCAIFALSHALQWLGFEGEEILPEPLAEKYAFCLRDGATINSTLVGNAGDALGFKTRFDLYTSLSSIREKMSGGAVFSFAVVQGHIAMVAEMNAEGTMFHVIDSALSATWERIGDTPIYRREADGSFTPVASPAELDGVRYYIENNAFGGGDYWLEADYIARRGVRLIQPEEPETP